MGNNSTKQQCNKYSPNTLSEEMLQLCNTRNSFAPPVDTLSLGGITLDDIQRSLNREKIQNSVTIDNTEVSRDEIMNYVREINSVAFKKNEVDDMDMILTELDKLDIQEKSSSIDLEPPSSASDNQLIEGDIEDILDELQIDTDNKLDTKELDLAISDLLKKVNIDKIKFKDFRSKLSIEYFDGIDLKQFSSYIKEQISLLLSENEDEDSKYEDDEDSKYEDDVDSKYEDDVDSKYEDDVDSKYEDDVDELMEQLENLTIKPSKQKECPPDKILNPKTGRCVLRTGKIGKEILRNMI